MAFLNVLKRFPQLSRKKVLVFEVNSWGHKTDFAA